MSNNKNLAVPKDKETRYDYPEFTTEAKALVSDAGKCRADLKITRS